MDSDRAPEDDTRVKPEIKKVVVREEEAKNRERHTIDKRPTP